MTILIEVFQSPEPPLYLNVLVFVWAIAVIAERAYALYLLYRVDTDSFVRFLVKLVKSGEHEKAMKTCQSSRKPISRVCRAGLAKAKDGAMEISMAIEEEMMRVKPLLEKRVSSLWALANIATLLGLLGTIMGLITSFRGLGAVSADKKAQFLSDGISTAMNNTFVGLAIAIVCMIGHLFISTAAKKRENELEIGVASFENFLVLQTRGEGK